MGGVVFGLHVSDAQHEWIAVVVAKDECLEYGQPLYWVEGEGFMVTGDYRRGLGCFAGVYAGDEVFGMRTATFSDERYRGTFVLVKGFVPEPPKIQLGSLNAGTELVRS